MLFLLAALMPALASTPEPESRTAPPVRDDTPAQADFDVPDAPDRIELSAWARAGYEARIEGNEVQHGPYLGMARLKTRFDHQDRYGVYLHFAGDGGNLRILDAEAHATLAEGLRITAGRMKVPVSHDFLIPVEKMLLPTRALLGRLAPGRAIGVQLSGTRHFEHLDGSMRLGLLDPLRVDLVELGGAQLVVQGDLHHHGGLFVHAAGAVWLHEKAATEREGTEGTWDERVDVAVGFDDDVWTLHAEGLIARPLHGDGPWQYGATAMAGHRIEIEHEHHLVLEPVLAFDLREEDDKPLIRGSAAVNLHEDGWHLLQTLAWEVDHVQGQPWGHRVVLQIQAGL